METSSQTRKTSSLFRYPGGKGKARHQILDAIKAQGIEPDTQYREPFFGGGAIGKAVLEDLLFHQPGSVWINDADYAISNLWTVATSRPRELIKAVEGYKPKVMDFYEFRHVLTTKRLEGMSKIHLALMKLVVQQFSFSGLGVMAGGPMGGRAQAGNTKFDCRWNADNIVKEILYWHWLNFGDAIYNSQCTNLDYLDLIADESCPALLYLDPPYYEKGEELYHHAFQDKQHVEMAQALKETPHKWVLSYDDHPKIRELYCWANIQPLDLNYSICGARKATEVLITPRHA